MGIRTGGKDTKTIHAASAATGAGTVISVKDFRHQKLQVSAAAASTLTWKVQASDSIEAPNFGAAKSATNHWDYLAVYDLNDPSTIIPGDTGVTFSAVSVVDSVRRYIVNDDYIRHLNVEITAYTAGSLTVTASAVND